MTVPAQSSIFSLALQPNKVGEAVYDESDYTWFRTRAPSIAMGTQQMQEVFPLETGGPIVPTGAFKSAQFAAGDVTMIPRLKEFVGLVLYALCGNITSQADAVWDSATDAFASTVTGANAHRFTFDPDNSFNLPWISTRTRVPGTTPGSTYGEISYDVKIASYSLTIPAAGLLGSSISFVGRKSIYPTAAETEAWVYTNVTEDSTSAPISGKGTFKIGGVEYPITGASIEMTNNLTTPQQEFIVGSYHPDDFVPLSRAVSIRIVYKWDNPDLYKQILTGTTTGTEWDSIPFIQTTAGATKAFEAEFQSPANIGGSSPLTPYGLKVIADKVVWQIDRGGIQLQAGNIIQVPYVGTVLEPDAGDEYIQFIVQNDATYTIPVAAGAADPVLTIAPTLTYAGSQIDIDATATLTDADSVDFNGGFVSMVMAGSEFNPADDLLVEDGVIITLSTLVVSVSATVIGTLRTALGAGVNLEMDLAVTATPALLETFFQNIQYHTVGAAARSGDVVTVTSRLADGDGGWSDQDITTITHS
jgi:hypothetical protein